MGKLKEHIMKLAEEKGVDFEDITNEDLKNSLLVITKTPYDLDMKTEPIQFGFKSEVINNGVCIYFRRGYSSTMEIFHQESIKDFMKKAINKDLRKPLN